MPTVTISTSRMMIYKILMINRPSDRMPREWVNGELQHCRWMLRFSLIIIVVTLLFQAEIDPPLQWVLWVIMAIAWWIGHESICRRDYLETL